MGTRLFPAPGVYFAAIEDDLVVLDSRRDSYACIPDGVAQLGFDAEASTLSPPEAAARAAVLAAGLATPRRETVPRPDLPGPPTATYAFQAPARLRLVDAWRLAGCVGDLVFHYRAQPLSRILAFVGRRRTRLPGRVASARELAVLSARFHGASVWLPDSRKCLVRSFLLLCFLHRSGCDAQWVFGVRTWPFGAHCWLQAGGAVLDDTVEDLRLYRPIRAA